MYITTLYRCRIEKVVVALQQQIAPNVNKMILHFPSKICISISSFEYEICQYIQIRFKGLKRKITTFCLWMRYKVRHEFKMYKFVKPSFGG